MKSDISHKIRPDSSIYKSLYKLTVVNWGDVSFKQFLCSCLITDFHNKKFCIAALINKYGSDKLRVLKTERLLQRHTKCRAPPTAVAQQIKGKTYPDVIFIKDQRQKKKTRLTNSSLSPVGHTCAT